MSSPGFFYGDNAVQPTDYKMMMARSLMGNNANPTTPYAGLSNIGGDIGGAYAMQNLQNQQQQKAYDAQAPITANLPYGNGQSTTLSTKLPYMGKQGGFLSNLFSFGGGS